jgi:Fusaric acid resistance protein-like
MRVRRTRRTLIDMNRKRIIQLPSQAWARAQPAVVPSLQAALAAAIAWFIADRVLRHPQPFFAPIAAAITMGTTPDQRRQRVVQLVIGVLLGIAIAEGLSAVLGTSTAALGLIVFVAFVAATFAGEAFSKGGCSSPIRQRCQQSSSSPSTTTESVPTGVSTPWSAVEWRRSSRCWSVRQIHSRPYGGGSLPVALDDLRGALVGEVRILAGIAQCPSLAQEVPEAIEVDPDRLQPVGVRRSRCGVVGPLALEQRFALVLEPFDLGGNLVV